MKKRAFALLNFLALNVLFFAVYLNFIHKDVNTLPGGSAATNTVVKTLVAGPQKNTVAANTQPAEKASRLQN
jgi:hypothetical protein